MNHCMLLETRHTDLSPESLVQQAGQVFTVFGSDTQDSGNVSYGVRAGDQRFFLKTAGAADAQAPLDRPDRIALLRNAIALHRSVTHEVLPALRNVIETPDGPVLVFDWVDGELLRVEEAQRSDPASPHVRFRRLPVANILSALDQILELHNRLASAGWIAVDFYDGALIYDFAANALHVFDLDHYQRGPFINRMGRMFGSSRFMAPEEFQLGAQIDERSTVFTMGRTIVELLSDSGVTSTMRGPAAVAEVAGRACQPDPRDRFGSLRELCRAWAEARSAAV